MANYVCIIRISRAKFHCSRLKIVQDHVSVIFWHKVHMSMFETWNRFDELARYSVSTASVTDWRREAAVKNTDGRIALYKKRVCRCLELHSISV